MSPVQLEIGIPERCRQRAAELYEEILSGGIDYPEAREQLKRCRARLIDGEEK